MTTREQALVRLLAVVHEDSRHAWYARTTELAALYRKLVTGDGLDSLLKPFVRREDDASFKQRVDLTNHVVTTTVGNIMDVFFKVPRANYVRVLEHDGKTDGPKTVELENKLKTFWGTKSLDAYMQTRWLEVNATDPNAFAVVEFKPFDNNVERASPYPFEVSSAQAVDYVYDNNVLQHLIVETEFPLPTDTDKKAMGKSYTVYLENETFVLRQINPKQASGIMLSDGKWTPVDGGAYLKSKDRVFMLVFPDAPHNAGQVPARQYGYKRDAWTNGESFVAPYEAAVPLLKKSIKVNSELDITMSQQVFPHRLQYMPKCAAPDCHDGYLSNGDMCITCKGSGHASITSAQEVIYFSMPKAPEDLIDLDRILVFKGPPIDVVSFQDKYVDKLTAACKAAVFNSESFTREQIQDTATGKMLDRDNVQDTLYTCSQGFSETWEFLVRVSAEFTQLSEGLDARLIFSKDFKLKGMTELVADLESAKRSQAGPAVIRHIQEQIARLMYADAPDMFRRWQVHERYNPFSGFSEEQIALALSSPGVPQRVKTRYYMFGMLFADLEAEKPNFYLLPEDQQREIIEAKVKDYMDESGANERPVLAMPANNGRVQPAVN